MNFIFLPFFVACQTQEQPEKISVSGGTWNISQGDALKIEQEGLGFSFIFDQYIFGYCFLDCVGSIQWNRDELNIQAEESLISLSSFQEIEANIVSSNIMIQGTETITVQSVHGDVWVEALPESRLSVLASYGDVDVNLPVGEWKTRLSGPTILSQVHSEEEGNIDSGLLEVYNIGGTIRVVEIKALSGF